MERRQSSPSVARPDNEQDGECVRISFDLDDTLICSSSVPAEQFVSWWRRWRYPEQLRSGTRALMTALMERGCEIWIYTSSGRSPRYLKSWFASCGILIEGIVNLDRHEQVIGLRGPSKFPPAFGIDLHVDDSQGVAMEGASHQFPVLMVQPDDAQWVERVLGEVDKLIEANVRWRARRASAQQPFELEQFFRDCLARLSSSDSRIPAYAVAGVKPDSI